MTNIEAAKYPNCKANVDNNGKSLCEKFCIALAQLTADIAYSKDPNNRPMSKTNMQKTVARTIQWGCEDPVPLQSKLDSYNP